MKFENTAVFNIEGALRGMRNPKNSWDKSDSSYNSDGKYVIGENDMKLAKTLVLAGSEHRKFLRQIFVSVDITAPLYWWKQFDTYKVGTTANSTSTMHKLLASPITVDCFEIDGLEKDSPSFNLLKSIAKSCDDMREFAAKHNDKSVWRMLISILPCSWLQKRTVTMNYENLYGMVHQRLNHKLNEWSGTDDPTQQNFMNWVKTLPYAEDLIFLDAQKT